MARIDMNSPYREKPFPFSVLRSLVRRFRIFKLRLLLRSKLVVGQDFAVGLGADIRSPEIFSVGNRVGIGKNFTVECDVVAGNDILISSNVSIVGNDHRFDSRDSTVYSQGRFPTPRVVLGGDNLVGFGVTIVGPCTIGKGCIIGAGSVVTRDLPEYSVCVGVPAKMIRSRFRLDDDFLKTETSR